VQLVRRRRARGEGAEEEEGVGVKRKELPPLPYLYHGAAVVGAVVVLHYPDRYCDHRHVVAPRGAAVPVTVPLGQLWAVIALRTVTLCDRSYWQSSCKFRWKLSDLASRGRFSYVPA
jgi:hypothetical protein